MLSAGEREFSLVQEFFFTAFATLPFMNAQLITVDPEIHSGTPVFFGTRVPIKTLFDHLEAGDTLEVFLDDFPSVSRDLAVAVLEEARTVLVADAHPA